MPACKLTVERCMDAAPLAPFIPYFITRQMTRPLTWPGVRFYTITSETAPISKHNNARFADTYIAESNQAASENGVEILHM